MMIINVRTNEQVHSFDTMLLEGNELEMRRQCYERVYGTPTHPEERATDATIQEYTWITKPIMLSRAFYVRAGSQFSLANLKLTNFAAKGSDGQAGVSGSSIQAIGAAGGGAGLGDDYLKSGLPQ